MKNLSPCALRLTRNLLCLGAGLLFASPLHANSPSAASAQEVLDRLVARNDGHGGGAARISGPDGVIWEGAAGLTAGPGSAPMTPDTPFEVASITKAVTAVVVMQLAEQGRLGLDDRISTLLPGQHAAGFHRDITVRQLLSHTSGLPDYWTDGPKDREGNNAFLRAFLAAPSRSWQPEEMVSFARELPSRKPGGRFHYSDTNYVLLGLIVEKAAGRPLHRVFRERVFDPLGMDSTWLTYREARRGPAPSHRFEGSDDLHNTPRQSADWAGGGLVSTARDLEKFLRGVASGRLFRNASTLDAMRASVPAGDDGISYGLGLYRVDLGDGKGELWGHDGHGNSFAYYWAERGVTLTGTLNQTENDWWPLAESYIEGESANAAIAESEESFEASLLTGWDSLYMDRGVNGLPYRSYGSGIYWMGLDLTWGVTENDFVSVNLWQCFATQGPSYNEFNANLVYTRIIDRLELDLKYSFQYAYSDGNYSAHELSASAGYQLEFGPVSLRPSLTYFFNIGPDAVDGYGFAETASSFLMLRVDGSVPVFRDIVALEPWGAFGVNFRYNSRDTGDEESAPFTGVNNLEFGVALPVKLHRHVYVSPYAAYSLALTDLIGTDQNTFWGGVSVVISY